MKGILQSLLTASDSQLDVSMVERLQVLLDSNPTDDQLKLGLKDILDLCAHMSLASDFVMRVLDMAWQDVGGKKGDSVSKAVLQEVERLKG